MCALSTELLCNMSLCPVQWQERFWIFENPTWGLNIFDLLHFLFFSCSGSIANDCVYWLPTGRHFQYEPHQRTQVPLLCMDEELMEILEDNQVQLQNLMSSKYVAHFLDEVSSWQNRLSVADTVISIWLEVQRTWTHLESIFIGSEDIRSQMPEVMRVLGCGCIERAYWLMQQWRF